MFINRRVAGKKLADKLIGKLSDNTVVLALPRGGVPVADEIAKKFGLPLDLILVRKIGHPYNPEFAVGAVTESGEFIADRAYTGINDEKWLDSEVKNKLSEIKERRKLFYKNKKQINIRDKTVLLVDDGAATGFTILASINETKSRGASKIIVALPVLPRDTAIEIEREVDEVVALGIPENFAGAIGSYYQNFSQVEDSEVVKILETYAND